MQERILGMVRAKKYRKVSELVSDLQESNDGSLSVEMIKEAISALEDEGKIALNEAKIEGSFLNHITRNYPSAIQLWLSLAVISLSLVSIYFLPGFEPFNIVRIVAGSIAVFLVSGYGLVGMLFPRRRDMPLIQRLGLGVMLSLVIVPILWVALNQLHIKTQNDWVVLLMSVSGILIMLASTYWQFTINKSKEVNLT